MRCLRTAGPNAHMIRRSSGTFSSVVHLYIKWLFALNEQSATRFGISESTM
jgi:hypothetical protein